MQVDAVQQQKVIDHFVREFCDRGLIAASEEQWRKTVNDLVTALHESENLAVPSTEPMRKVEVYGGAGLPDQEVEIKQHVTVGVGGAKEPEAGTPDPIKAQYFAQIAHGTQLYNDELPYPFHLQRVVDVLRRFGFSGPEWECAGWLHDVIEDTNKSYSDILRRFGLVVAERVYAVTAAKGRNRKERNGPTYAAIKEKEEYIILKLADRIANLEYGLASPDGKVDMYRKEFPDFEKGIRFEDRSREDPQVTRMWNTVKLLLGLPVG